MIKRLMLLENITLKCVHPYLLQVDQIILTIFQKCIR